MKLINNISKSNSGLSFLFAACFWVLLFLLQSCASGGGQNREEWYTGTGRGYNIQEAEMEVRLAILEQALGSIVVAESSTMDSQLKYSFIQSRNEGFLHSFEKISESREGELYIIQARAGVSPVQIKDALKQRMEEIGKPVILPLIQEIRFGEKTGNGVSLAELELQSRLSKRGFRFKDREMLVRRLAKEQGMKTGIYGNPSLEEKALSVAGEMESEILLVGKVNIVDAGEIRAGSGLRSYQATGQFKLISTGTGERLAAMSYTGIAPDIDDGPGADSAVKALIDSVEPDLIRQIETGWVAGSVTSLLFRGMSSGEYIRENTGEGLRGLRGVTGVRETGARSAGFATEVRCFCSSYDLAKSIQRQSWRFGDEWEIEEAKGNAIILSRKK